MEALEEMNKLGMIFDVSHLTDSVFWDVASTVKGPFIASHSNSRAVCDHPRNLTDDMKTALGSSLSTVFFITFIIVAAVFVLNFFLREVPLRKQHVIDESKRR